MTNTFTGKLGNLVVDSKDSESRYNHITSVMWDLLIYGNVRLPNLKSVGGTLYIGPDCDFDYSGIKFGAGLILEISWYALYVSPDGTYRAGCRGPLDSATALKHWDEDHPVQARAKAFREAILAHEGGAN